MEDGPYPCFTVILCHEDGYGVPKTAAFAEAAEARAHAGRRVAGLPAEWTSALVARGVRDNLEFVGAWDRDAEGELIWENASLA